MLFHEYRRKRAIRQYLRRLPKYLARDHGRKRKYSPDQVRESLSRHWFPMSFACYALAIYSPRSAFDRDHRERGEECDYEGMREFVGDTFFSGGGALSVSSLLATYGDSPLTGGSSGADSFAEDGSTFTGEIGSGGGFDGGGGFD